MTRLASRGVRTVLRNLTCLAILLYFLSPSSLAQVDRARDDYNFSAGLYDRGLDDRAVRAFKSFFTQQIFQGAIDRSLCGRSPRLSQFGFRRSQDH